MGLTPSGRLGQPANRGGVHIKTLWLGLGLIGSDGPISASEWRGPSP